MAYRKLSDTELDFVAGGLRTDPGPGNEPETYSIDVPQYQLPAGMFVEDVYAVDFEVDMSTGLMTAYLWLDDGSGGDASYAGTDQNGMNSGAAKDGGMSTNATTTTKRPTCTLTLTSTQTSTSGSGSITGSIGILGGSRSTGSTTTTTTRSVSVQGQLINGKCVTPTVNKP